MADAAARLAALRAELVEALQGVEQALGERAMYRFSGAEVQAATDAVLPVAERLAAELDQARADERRRVLGWLPDLEAAMEQRDRYRAAWRSARRRARTQRGWALARADARDQAIAERDELRAAVSRGLADVAGCCPECDAAARVILHHVGPHLADTAPKETPK